MGATAGSPTAAVAADSQTVTNADAVVASRAGNPTAGVTASSQAVVVTNQDAVVAARAGAPTAAAAAQATGVIRRKLRQLRIEAELTAGVWTRIDGDVVGDIRWASGIRGNGPFDRTADTGDCSFALDSGDGRYILNRGTALAGWRYGTPLRIAAVIGSDVHRQWTGNVASIAPPSGPRGSRLVHVAGVDWFARADRKVRPPLQIDKRADQIIQAGVDALTSAEQPPGGTDLDQGSETYPYALHEARDGIVLRSLIARAARNELGLVFLTRGGELRFLKRVLVGATSVAMFDETNTPDDGLDVASDIEDLYTSIQVTVHPLRVDASRETVYTLDQPLEIAAAADITLTFAYRNREREEQTIGAFDLDVPTFTANAAEDGSGTDRASSLTLTVTATAGAAQVRIENAHAGAVYLTTLELTGRGIYDLSPVTVVRQATDPEYDRTLTYDLRWQSDPGVGDLIANTLLRRYQETQRVRSIQVVASKSADLLEKVVGIEIGDIVTVCDALSGTASIAQVLGFEYTCRPNLQVDAKLYIGPVHVSEIFELDRSTLGGGDVLG